MDPENAHEMMMGLNVGTLAHILKGKFSKEDTKNALEITLERIKKMSLDLEVRRQEGAQYSNENAMDNTNVYPLQKGPGCVLMMSNSFEGGRMSREKASEKDLTMMGTLWKIMGNCEFFSVDEADEQSEKKHKPKKPLQSFIKKQIGDKCVYKDLDGDMMEYMLEKLSDTKKDYSYIVVYISSHGGRMSEARVKDYQYGKRVGNEKLALEDFKECEEKGINRESSVQVFLGNDKKPVREDRMLELFHNHKNEKLDGIPKFFILDYCRSTPKTKQNAKPHKEDRTKEDESSVYASLPVMSDILVLSATHDYFFAYDDETGSKLTKSLYDVFMENDNYKHKEAVDMLTMVNARMKKECSKDQAMCTFQSSLDKKFYFFYQLNTPPSRIDRKRCIPPKPEQPEQMEA